MNISIRTKTLHYDNYLSKNPFVLIFKLSPTLLIKGAVPGLFASSAPKDFIDGIPRECCVEESKADVLFLILIAGTDCGRLFFSIIPILLAPPCTKPSGTPREDTT